MTRKDYWILFGLGLLVALVVATLQHSPGYMDAEYYLLSGQTLAAGAGLRENILWNYLDVPAGLPHPAHSYWMPLPALLAAAGLRWLGGWWGARSVFLLAAASLPPLSAYLSMLLTGRRGSARVAGWLALLPGFYLPYIATTDSFALAMLLGALFFVRLAGGLRTAWQAVALGALAGGLHLARAEGPLWLLLALWAAWRLAPRRGVWLSLAGYSAVMAPWWLRNLAAFGSPLAPGGSLGLWLTNYDELFSYPASQLTLQHWLASGWPAIVAARASALGQNLASTLVVSGLVALAPLVVWGAWRLRRHAAVQASVLAWLALLLVFSVIFPFAGARGGFFHAAAALQPLVWALAAAGLHAALEWGAARRGWELTRAGHIFSLGVLGLALALSAYAVQVRVSHGAWDAGYRHYVEVAEQLDAWGIAPETRVLVNNPAGFSLASGRPAIVIPHGGPGPAGQAAQRYDARLLILEANHQPSWDAIYSAGPLLSSLQFLGEVGDTRIFRLP
ncbi:MAG: hypothetical protein KF828_02355 [Anaerolineales bacterium]|nr:hypothetical protein [Anaerolineales bacterium]